MNIIQTNMESKTINQKEAIDKIQSGEDVSVYNIVFNQEKVEALEAILLGRNKIIVPENLIYYNDQDIDYSDDAALTDDDLESGKIQWTIRPEIHLEKEITDWIKQENIKLDELVPHLLKSFYQSVKFAQKNAAL